MQELQLVQRGECNQADSILQLSNVSAQYYL